MKRDKSTKRESILLRKRRWKRCDAFHQGNEGASATRSFPHSWLSCAQYSHTNLLMCAICAHQQSGCLFFTLSGLASRCFRHHV